MKISRWWIFALCFTLIIGFTVLISITGKAYIDKPPIPEVVVSSEGQTLFTGNDIRSGQEVFLSKGLMSNGTVWGHGSMLGPDFPALTLHRMGVAAAKELAQEKFGKPFDQLSKQEQDEVNSLVPSRLKVNRYDPSTGQLTLTKAQTQTFEEEPAYWKDYLSNPAHNGGLSANLITDPTQLKNLSAYFTWMAWGSVTPRPGEKDTYTNNFPYDPLVGNYPSTSAFIWSAVSILFLLGGIGLTLFVLGRNPDWDWHSPAQKLTPIIPNSMISPSQAALVKFVVIVALMLLLQTLVGGGVAHFRADPGNFYGFDLSAVFPSSLLRTWHLQFMIFWVATGFVVGGLFLSRVLGGQEYKWEKFWTNILFIAFFIVIACSILGVWGGLLGWWPGATFWLGSQGWEYLELGRIWQILLIVGLLVWFFIIWRNAKPALKNPATKALAVMFLIAAFSIPFFYLPAVFYTDQTNYTIVDTWRFWIIHLWVEGFFELFATTMVALTFIELGFVSRKMGLRLIFLDGVLIFMGGVIGTGHHWYFSGMTTLNMILSGCFSAMEIVPLVVLCVEAGNYIKTANAGGEGSLAYKFKWPVRFMMSVGFWNFVGAGVCGFLINMPIVSYFEIGTYLTPNHGHAAMFGVFGLLAIALCLMVLRQACDDNEWKHVEGWVKVSFWGFNIGLAFMLILSLLPGGFMQLWDVFQNGYWHARSPEFTNDGVMSFIGWLRMPADLVFICFGAIPLLVAALKVWFYRLRLPKKAA